MCFRTKDWIEHNLLAFSTEIAIGRQVSFHEQTFYLSTIPLSFHKQTVLFHLSYEKRKENIF